MSCYLTEAEIPKYCGLYAGIRMAHVEAASALIDAYKGCTFEPVKHKEHVKLSRKGYMGELRGKLIHYPRVKIYAVKAEVISPFSGRGEVMVDTGCVHFDDDESQYFTFYMPRQLMFRSRPSALTVEYVSGFAEPPEAVKKACGILAGNIQTMGGVMRWKQRDDYDIKVTLADEGVFTNEVRLILQGVVVK